MLGNKRNSSFYTTRNKVQLVRGGHEYFTLLLNLVNAATHSIHLQTYIFEDDETGLLVVAALINAARRQVRVYFIADGYASGGLSKSFIERLEKEGIHFKYFEP